MKSSKQTAKGGLHLRQRYRDSHLQAKFTLVIMITVIVPAMMVGLFFYGRLYDMVVSDTIRREQDASAQTAPLIENTVNEVMDAYQQITSHEFYRTVSHITEDTSAGDVLSLESADKFCETISALQAEGLITNVRLYIDFPKENSDKIKALFDDERLGGCFASTLPIRGTYWYGIFQGTHTAELFCPSFYLGTREKEEYGDTAYIHASSFLYGNVSYRVYTAVYFTSERFSQILSENLALSGSVSYIMNERDSLVASSDESLSGIYWLDYDTIRASFMSSNNFIERTILDRKIYAGFYSITRPGWFMVTILPSEPLALKSKLLMLQFVLLYLFFIILAVVLASLLAHSITHRISSVISQMRSVRQGTLTPMASPKAHDEIGDLIDTYNYMTRKMNSLMDQQAQAAEDLRVAEFKSLQAQINPHFLYNTMDMINWLAQQGRTDEISNAVQTLSRFYRLTLSRKSSISSIAGEEEHVSIYVRLQNMRYHDSIDLICDIPDELMEYQIPRLTLQPVVENAILHGILAKESKSGTIVLTAWMERDDIVILISDDGVGMPDEKLASILTGSGQSASGGTNIAVYNTHRRLQILYGADYGLRYRSEPGKGTEVEIRIPARKEAAATHPPASSELAKSKLFPLVTFSSKDSAGVNVIAPETLLAYSQKITQDLYNLKNLHQVSESLPAGEHLFIVSHEVTEDFPAHTHAYFELNYLCSGSIVNVVDGAEVYMSPGDLILLNETAVHSLRYREPNTLLVNFCLQAEVFDRTMKTFLEDDNPISAFIRGRDTEHGNYLFFPLRHNVQIQTLLTSIIQEYAGSDFHLTFSLEGLFILLFAQLAASEEFSYYGTDADTHERIEYLRSHYLQQDLREIAMHFGVTPEAFDASIRRHTGRSAEAYLQEMKIEHAAELLANPNLNIFEIARTCGFPDSDSFFCAFQENFHVSPTEYRKHLF